MPVPGDVIAGKYRIRSILGQGGMGAVFRAEHSVTGQQVAVKVVLPRRGEHGRPRERLMREAQLAGRIDHPNVVRVHDVGEHGASIFLVMELLRGETLKDLAERGPHPAAAVVATMMPVLRSVAAVHRANIIHRDLKPENVVLSESADSMAVRPTLIDFGISRSESSLGGDDMSLTQTGFMVGTPLYMAPEQLAGKGDVQPGTDVYAIGIILYELLTGGQPFESETYGLLVAEKLHSEAIPASDLMPGIDPGLERVVMRALEQAPEKRYGSVDELGRALEPYAGGASYDSRDPFVPLDIGLREEAPSSSTVRVRRIPRRRKAAPKKNWLPVMAAAMVLFGLVIGGTWVYQQRSVEPKPEEPPALASEPGVPVERAVVAPAPEERRTVADPTLAAAALEPADNRTEEVAETTSPSPVGGPEEQIIRPTRARRTRAGAPGRTSPDDDRRRRIAPGRSGRLRISDF